MGMVSPSRRGLEGGMSGRNKKKLLSPRLKGTIAPSEGGGYLSKKGRGYQDPGEEGE